MNVVNNHNPLSARDQLVLLLISKSEINNVFKLGMRFDRCDFPGNVDKNLSVLLDQQLIAVSVANQFNRPIKYTTTEKGENFLRDNLNPSEIIKHIRKMSEPDFMLDLVQLIFKHEFDFDVKSE